MTAAERSEWDAANMKGAYNASDLNRVSEALNYIRDRFVECGYMKANAYTAKTNWATGTIPAAAELSALLGYARTARAVFAVMDTTPTVPADTGGLSFAEANDIEKILLDIDQLITNMLAARYFCGELYSGEV